MQILTSIRYRSRVKGWPCTLTVRDIPNVPEVCPVLGIVLRRPEEFGDTKRHDGSPSVDRIDSKLPYEVGNIRVISNKANVLKSNATAAEMKLVLADLEKCERKALIKKRLTGTQEPQVSGNVEFTASR